MGIPFLFSNGSLTFMVQGATLSVRDTHPNFGLLVKAVTDPNPDRQMILNLYNGVSPAIAVMDVHSDFFHDGIKISEDKAFDAGVEITSLGISKYIGACRKLGLPLEGFCKFLRKLRTNVRFRVQEQLFKFMDNVGLIINDMGNIIAYKAVTSGYKDKWTGKIDNRPGCSPSMKPGDVCDDPNQACGPGLHAGALEYVYGYGSGDDHLIIVEINPEDVVSIPYDCGCQKLRTCRYHVVGDYNGELKSTVYEAGVSTKEMYKQDDRVAATEDHDKWFAEKTQPLVAQKKKHSKRGPDGRFVK